MKTRLHLGVTILSSMLFKGLLVILVLFLLTFTITQKLT